MTLVMAYVILIAASIGACAAVAEMVARSRGVPARWIWVTALVIVAGATVAAMTVPRPAPDVVPVREMSAGLVPPPGGALVARSSSAPVVSSDAVLRVTDTVLPPAWLMATTALLVAIAFGRHLLRRERQRSRPAALVGHDVLLTDQAGPAVAGLRRPVVFVPRWVLALDDPSQRLLLAHEMEHVRRRDTMVLFAGAVAAALMPWNAVVWWLVRRLRLAVEQDCDARVLAAHPDVRRYADLLLTAASRHGLASRLLAARFGEHASDLLRRIEAMTSKGRLPWRRITSGALAAAVLTVVSCETPRPEPVAPLSPRAEAPDASASVYEEIVKPAPLSGSRTPKYPENLRQAGVEGEVLVSFTVDESGQPDVATFKVIRSTHELFSVAVREALPGMRFRPAERDGRKVKLTVQEPFTFTLVGAKPPQERRMWPKDALQETVVTGIPGKARPAFILRGATSNSVSGSPLIIVDGVVMKGDLKDIDPQTIERIEVVKGAAASRIHGPRAKNGVIQITTKMRRRVP
jgi:TonB family protein